jgi:predicted nucleotidyltransferase component of viral defense system
VDYYLKKIYPLQDSLLKAFTVSPFHLTGGTALARGYYNHRYSDDLRLEVHDHPDFSREVERRIKKIREAVDRVNVGIKETNFYRIFAGSEQVKLEMINRGPARLGKPAGNLLLGLVDSRENILAGKIQKIVEKTFSEDIVDFYFLLRDGIDLKKVLTDMESPAAGIPPLFLAKKLHEFNYGSVDEEINWVVRMSHRNIENYLKNISRKIVEGI